jgi:hypothetical protein
MNIRKNYLPFVISIVPLLLIILEFLDFFDLLKDKGAYPFEHEAYYSIYRSETVYIIYKFLFIIILVFMIYCAFKRNRKLFLITFCVAAMFFLYPILTAQQ